MTGRKIIASLMCVLVTGLLLTGCSTKNATDQAPKTTTFRLAENQPPDYPTTVASKKFAELVNERTKGRIKIEVYPSGQLGDEKSVIEQVQMGAIAFTRVHSSPLAEFSKPFSVFSLPYVFENENHMWKFLEGDMGTKMLDTLASSKMQGLAYYDNGARSLYFKKPVKSLEEIKGLKIRVQQNRVTMEMVNAFGASPTPMPYGEVFSSLQTGVIDSAENNFPSYYTSNHYQAAKYCLLNKHQRAPEVLLMSKFVWDKMSEEDKKILKQSALEAGKYQRQLWTAFEKDSEAKLRAAGVTITDVTDFKPWQAAVKPVIDKYGAEFKAEMEAIEKARK
ncbi:C4-dicarboxylate ABC transporter [Anaerosporomusa subterranea]|uniref:C4-dicarboxylate ABC transporter n=1 Tax=Anaerosporomusa subterranea TaxID=1794912 RepID=A0A154BS69_ANASB|nr:TRAP transporter substrate-binding protein [Anaerosporomusa subterranea]KYZ76670.1 C4-dicarboxylate ABC transporter [Anaerosporomusa subterranea]